MTNSEIFASNICRCRYRIALLLSVFAVGFLSGTTVTFADPGLYSLLVRSAVVSPVSISALITRIVFTAFLCVVIFDAKTVYLPAILCFVYAFSYGVVSMAIFFAFGSAYWLTHLLLLFTGMVNSMCVLWFWCRRICVQRQSIYSDFFLALFVSSLAGFFDFFLISPYLSSLFIS